MHRLVKALASGLHSRNGLIRKGSAFALRAPKRIALATMRPEDLKVAPPILADSIPKSGTHLLEQIAAGFPHRVNYGAFLASLTSSFQIRLRTEAETLRLIDAIVPGELVRAHLFFDSRYADALRRRNAVHYFIYRDPRDVIVSSCHYLRGINRWHRWAKYFKRCETLEQALLLSIRGLRDAAGQALVPNVAERFAPYEPWLTHADVCAIRFEDLRGGRLLQELDRMLEFYAVRSAAPLDRDATLEQIRQSIAPEKSHTFRAGSTGGWREAFSAECQDAFKEVAGEMLVRLGYEQGNDG